MWVTDRAVRLQRNDRSERAEQRERRPKDRDLQVVVAKLSHFKSFAVAAAHLPATQACEHAVAIPV